MFKNTNSIKNQLYRLAILQCLLVIVFWLYLIISKTMSLLNTVNYQISQNSEKILTQLDNDLSVLSRTTLFPVNRSLFANNDSDSKSNILNFNRHDIMHGLDNEYGTFENLIRCLLIIDFLNDCLSEDLQSRLN